jgi:hypothetical protein
MCSGGRPWPPDDQRSCPWPKAPSLQPTTDLDFRTSYYIHCKKRLLIFPSPAGMSSNQTLPGREYFNYCRPGRVWLVTSQLGMGKSRTFFTVHKRLCVKGKSKSQKRLSEKNDECSDILCPILFSPSCFLPKKLLFYHVLHHKIHISVDFLIKIYHILSN